MPVRITRQVHPKVKAEPAPPPPSSGIDYLGLIAERSAAKSAAGLIDYAALAERERIERDRESTNTDIDERGRRPVGIDRFARIGKNGCRSGRT